MPGMPDLGGMGGNGDEPGLARIAGWTVKKEAEEEKEEKATVIGDNGRRAAGLSVAY